MTVMAPAFSPEALRDRAAAPIASADRFKWALLGCIAFLYLPLIFAGPGSDPDSLRELRSGTTLLWQHRYVMSRPPGYFPYEALCGFLYTLGGVVASNLATLAMSLLLLHSFLGICGYCKVPHRHLLAIAIATNPVYWVNSASTIDFIWALGCFMLGFRWFLEHRYLGAAIVLGLAVGIRVSSILLAGPVLVWQLIERPRDAQLWMAAALATALGAALYLPEFIVSGNSFGFLTYYVGTWSLTGHLGRFLYKNIYFWGLPATIFLLAAAPVVIRELARCDREFGGIVALSTSIVLLFEALFLKLPVQRAYLLPMLPFVLILLGIALRDRVATLVALVFMIFSYNLVNLNLARPDTPDHATQAKVGLFVEPGYLLEDLRVRRAVAHEIAR